MMLFFLIIFIFVPLIEIYLFIKIGEIIGSVQTILIVILTALIGVLLIKREGKRTLNNLRFSTTNKPLDLFKTLGDGLFIVISGVFLITPGFATDIFGFILFVRWVRNLIIMKFIKKISLSEFNKFNNCN